MMLLLSYLVRRQTDLPMATVARSYITSPAVAMNERPAAYCLWWTRISYKRVEIELGLGPARVQL